MSEVLGLALPEGNKTGPNCGVTAVAIAAQLPFSVVYAEFARRHKGNYKGRTTILERNRVMENFGVSWTKIQFYRMNLRTWVRRCSKPNTLYMVTTTGHVQMVFNGIITDQNGVFQADVHPFSGKQIREILIINRDVSNISLTPAKEVPKKEILKEFYKGQKVMFLSQGISYKGEIIRANALRAKVFTEDGRTWRVPYQLLRSFK